MREPLGYFLLERGGDQGPLTDAQLTSKNVVGQTIRIPWSRIHKGRGEFDWRELDARIAQCQRTNRLGQLLIQTGRDGYSPKWFGGQMVTDKGKEAPAPWSPQMMDAWAELWGELGLRYRGTDCIVSTKITGPTWPSAEMHPCPGLKTKKGYSKAAMTSAWKSAGVIVAEAFPFVAASLAISVQAEANSYVRDVIGELSDALGDQLRIQHNALKNPKDMHPKAAHHELVKECHKLGIGVGFEMVGPLGRDVVPAINYGKLAGGRWFDVYPQPADIQALKAA